MNIPRWMTVVSMGLLAAALAQPQFGGYYNGNGNPYNGGSGSGSGSGSGTGSGSGSTSGSGSSFDSGQARYADFDFERAALVRAVHGILGAVAMVVMFPTGAMLMRILPGRIALWSHGIFQVLALGMLAGAVGLGLNLVENLRAGVGVYLMSDPNINYHPIIGLVVFACLLLQPVFGHLHHQKFKQVHRRQKWSYIHLFNGRVFITLGIVNGALGLWIAGASHQFKTAYVTAAAAMCSVWLGVALWSEWHRKKESWRQQKPNEGEVSF